MKHKDSFDLIRLSAALAVLISHQFAVLGQPQPYILGSSLGALGVSVFFVVSGFFVFQSWERDPNFLRFLKRRALRILPAFIVLVLLSIFLLGPLATTKTLREYFEAPQTWRYFKNLLFIPQYVLPGVFTSNPVPNAVNGSIWSLQPEAMMYLFVALSGLLAFTTRIYALIAAALVIVGSVLILPEDSFRRSIVNLAAFFLAGMLYWRLRSVLLRWQTLIAASLFASAAALFGYGHLALWLVIPPAVLLLGQIKPFRSMPGDWSYGTYLYAFPVQQIVIGAGVVSFFSSFALVVVFTTGLAILSWRLIEQPALRLKPRATLPANRPTDLLASGTSSAEDGLEKAL